ncbi:MAG: HD domain-containing protein [Patescibacteria group bacterium]
MEVFPIAKIDRNKVTTPELLATPIKEPTATSTALKFGAFIMRFARVERRPRYDEYTRENNAEHSHMVSVVATELGAMLYRDKLDLGLVSQFGNAHDFIEAIVGDTATFHHNQEDMNLKTQREHASLPQLLAELPPYHASLVIEYEKQEKIEAIFVRCVDKNLPIIVDILGEGKKVMAEDYGVTTLEQLQEAHRKLHDRVAECFKQFPELIEMHRLLCELFQVEFGSTPKHSTDRTLEPQG